MDSNGFKIGSPSKEISWMKVRTRTAEHPVVALQSNASRDLQNNHRLQKCRKRQSRLRILASSPRSDAWTGRSFTFGYVVETYLVGSYHMWARGTVNAMRRCVFAGRIIVCESTLPSSSSRFEIAVSEWKIDRNCDCERETEMEREREAQRHVK